MVKENGERTRTADIFFTNLHGSPFVKTYADRLNVCRTRGEGKSSEDTLGLSSSSVVCAGCGAQQEEGCANCLSLVFTEKRESS